MSTTRQDGMTVYSLRVKREQLDRLAQIAELEHRVLSQKLRLLIEDEIARHDKAYSPLEAA